MTCLDFKIIDHNYLFQDNVKLVASSEAAAFPLSNIRHFFRSKVWRTSGHYEITADNCKINFKEDSIGPELTATLSAGSYTSATLSAAIKAALEAAGASTYTVEYTAGRYSISTSGVFLSILFGSGIHNATSCAEAIGFTEVDYTGSISYSGSSLSIHTSEWLSIDLSTREEIDAFAIVFDNAQKVKFSGQARIWIQASETPLWDNPAIDQEVFIDGDMSLAAHYWEAYQSYRYWRVKIVDPNNYYGYLEIPKIFIGRKVGTVRIPSIGFTLSHSDQSKRERTDYGHEYIDLYPIKRKISISLNLCDNADAEKIWNSFHKVGTTHPVLVVMDGQEVLFSKERMTIYGRYSGDLTSKHVIRDIMNQDIDIEETF